MGQLCLRMSAEFLDGDLADEPDSGVETEVLIALCTDARVDAAQLPKGRPNRGWWADALEPELEPYGSAGWLLEGATPTPDNAALLSEYAAEAVAPIIRAGRLLRFEAHPDQAGVHLTLSPVLTLPEGAERRLGLLRVN